MSIQNVNSILSQNPITEDSYVLVRSDVFLFLQLTNNEKDIFDSGTKTDSKPNVVFYQEDSDTKAILDYTVASDKDKSYLDVLFKGLNDFSGLSLTNASYLDERNSIDTSLNASLQFREFKNNMLFTKVLSPVSSGNLNKVFDGIYFLDTPQITTDASWSTVQGSVNSLLICTNPKTTTNFNNFSINTGDLVEIVNPNSANNTIKYEVLEYLVLNNKQIIRLKNLGIPETLIGSSTVLNFYAKSKTQPVNSVLGLDTTILGCCLNTQTNQTYDNTTEYECYVRTEGYYSHFKSQSCSTVSTIAPTVVTTSNFTAIDKFFITTAETPSIVFDVSININPLMNEILLKVKSGSSSVLQSNIVYLNPNKLYTFEQTSTSNYKKILRFSTTKDTLTPYLDGVFGLINENALKTIHYLRTTNSTPTLYLFTEDEPNIASAIEIRVLEAV